MRPYLDRGHTSDGIHRYDLRALNDYGRYLLPHQLLEDEYQFLRKNLHEAIALNDPETLGEFWIRSRTRSEQLRRHVRAGMSYLLDTQRADGTWSLPDEKIFTFAIAPLDRIDGRRTAAGSVGISPGCARGWRSHRSTAVNARRHRLPSS